MVPPELLNENFVPEEEDVPEVALQPLAVVRSHRGHPPVQHEGPPVVAPFQHRPAALQPVVLLRSQSVRPEGVGEPCHQSLEDVLSPERLRAAGDPRAPAVQEQVEPRVFHLEERDRVLESPVRPELPGRRRPPLVVLLQYRRLQMDEIHEQSARRTSRPRTVQGLPVQSLDTHTYPAANVAPEVLRALSARSQEPEVRCVP